MSKKEILKKLQQIPGIGKSIAQDLYDLDIRNISDLVGKDPQAMYDQLCRMTRQHQDRCVLYVFRCAVYFASHEKHESELLKWWNWKD